MPVFCDAGKHTGTTTQPPVTAAFGDGDEEDELKPGEVADEYEGGKFNTCAGIPRGEICSRSPSGGLSFNGTRGGS